MTLCVRIATPRMTIHVSDRRVTWIRDGRMVSADDNRNKAIVYWCGSGRFLISYCGLATLEGRATDDWITHAFASLSNADKVPNLWRHLLDKITVAYVNSRPPTDTHLEVIATGYSSNLSLETVITNARNSDGFAVSPTGQFRILQQWYRELPVKTGLHRYFMIEASGSGAPLFNRRF